MLSNKPSYPYAVIIGRFQPFHTGHLYAIREALKIAESVIVLIGSAWQPRTIKNPFSAGERGGFIRTSLTSSESDRVIIDCICDHPYDELEWIKTVQQTVFDITKGQPTAIVGHDKDTSSYYLKRFPQWTFVDVGMEEEINATNIRHLYFTGDLHYVKSVLPGDVYEMMDQFTKTEQFAALVDEFTHIERYKKSWAAAPFPPTFVTTDAVVIQGGHVLMVYRKASPGRGLLALPGGFLNQDEYIFDGCVRELYEETKIKVPEEVIRRSVINQGVFDHPSRSLRGRTITHAFVFGLTGGDGKLPKVKGSDDAAKAVWIPIGQLDSLSGEIFEDHLGIIKSLVHADGKRI